MKGLFKYIVSILLIGIFFTSSLGQENHPLLNYEVFNARNNFSKHILKDELDEDSRYLIMLSKPKCHWCKEACSQWLEYKQKWENEFDTKIIIISRTDKDNLQTAVQPYYNAYPYDLYATQQSYRPLGVTGVPTVYFINYNRKVEGTTSWFPILVEDFIKTILSNGNYSIFKEANYRIWNNEACDDESSLTYQTTIQKSGSLDLIHIQGDVEKLIYIQKLLNALTTADGKVIYPLSPILCHEIEVYDPIHETSISGKVIDTYIKNGLTHYETDIPLISCSSSTPKKFTLIENIGSNAGILPYVTEEGIISSVNCVEIEDSFTYTHDNSGNCTEITSADDISNEPNKYLGYPNPTRDHITFNNPEITPFIDGVYDVHGKNVLNMVKVKSGSMDVNHLTSGIYFVKLSTSQVYKFIKI